MPSRFVFRGKYQQVVVCTLYVGIGCCGSFLLRPAPITSHTQHTTSGFSFITSAATCAVRVNYDATFTHLYDVCSRKANYSSLCLPFLHVHENRWGQLARRREEEELVNGARSEDLDDELELHRVIDKPGWELLNGRVCDTRL